VSRAVHRPTRRCAIPDAAFTPRDLELLAARGVSVTEAERQLALLRSPPPAPRLVRPCTLGDGIDAIPDARADALEALAMAAAGAGRVTIFVPASGAATRMFQDLLACRALPGPLTRADVESGAAEERRGCATLLRFVDAAERFAFAPALRAALARNGADLDALLPGGPYRPLLDALLDREGLGYADAPKGLLPFHTYPDGVRTAFDEHRVEAARVARDAQGVARLHLTVSPEHRAAFEARRDAAPALAGVRPEIGFSEQKPATDTLAIDDAGAPFRDATGALLLRPAGHGALIENLADLGGDLVFLKNVDNVAVDPFKPPSIRWARVLVGRLVELETRCRELRARLATGDRASVDEAAAFLRETFGGGAAPGATSREALLDQLDRPLRVCGMVPNTGEPGGGPFWVHDASEGIRPQIVESAQVDARDPEQQRRFASGTHFNPVFLACAMRDAAGRPHDLARFVDPDTAIVTRKSADGRALVALERPGLWNGAMGRWNTVFVEVPLAVFNPVKTVLDLLRPEHQPAG